MQEDSSRAHSVMSSGKADASTSCLPSQCFDSLTKSCVKCLDLYRDNTTEPAHAVPTSTPIPSADVPGTVVMTVGLAVMGQLLLLVAICVFLAWKVRRQRRKRKEPDEEAKEKMDSAVASSSAVQQDFTALAADDDFALAKCPHVNGAAKVPGPPRKDAEKQRLCCQGNPGGDVIVLSPLSPCLEECNHCFPLPATELGATALVTTKTTQKTCINEEMA
ncbi:tumor necrosis factor receptor superfamily member 13C [Nothoprocta perdicaria]|uniref:tumor necrosis factor receptor superfamily member 13C n=1 Tax=Nothoprocta perdicaria TaxID=30464 RepID=UPI000E1B930F|nr:tumor necrosis factor receptor superfamily member 13C [Nothoprocta perdicaria]